MAPAFHFYGEVTSLEGQKEGVPGTWEVEG